MTTNATIDMSKFNAVADALRKWPEERIIAAVTSQTAVRRITAYMTTVMQRMIQQGAILTEGETMMLRGVIWAGWATWRVKKYNEEVIEGTRWYWRKFRRETAGDIMSAEKRIKAIQAKAFLSEKDGADLAKLQRLVRVMRATYKGQNVSAAQRKKLESTPVKDRPWERVWRPRASGQRYSGTNDKMMRDTGALFNSFVTLGVSVIRSGRTSHLKLTPGNYVKYFQHQNKMRPMFFVEAPKDVLAIRDIIQDELNKSATWLDRLKGAFGY